MADRDELARALYEQWLLGEYPDTNLAEPDWDWPEIPQARQISKGHRKEYCRDFWLCRADAILASDWLARVRADEREACAKVADDYDAAWARREQQARGAKSVARDFETMSIAAGTIAAAIREPGQ